MSFHGGRRGKLYVSKKSAFLFSNLSEAKKIEVSVTEGVEEFKNLEADLAAEEKKATPAAATVEAGTGFNIREFFEESVRQEESKGLKPKRVGLVVKNLTVSGAGTESLQIEDNLSPLKSLWPGNWYEQYRRVVLF